MSRLWRRRTDERTDGKWKIEQCSVGPETANGVNFSTNAQCTKSNGVHSAFWLTHSVIHNTHNVQDLDREGQGQSWQCTFINKPECIYNLTFAFFAGWKPCQLINIWNIVKGTRDPRHWVLWLIKHLLVQSRSFNKLWNLGRTSAWLYLAKGENT